MAPLFDYNKNLATELVSAVWALEEELTNRDQAIDTFRTATLQVLLKSNAPKSDAHSTHLQNALCEAGMAAVALMKQELTCEYLQDHVRTFQKPYPTNQDGAPHPNCGDEHLVIMATNVQLGLPNARCLPNEWFTLEKAPYKPFERCSPNVAAHWPLRTCSALRLVTLLTF